MDVKRPVPASERMKRVERLRQEGPSGDFHRLRDLRPKPGIAADIQEHRVLPYYTELQQDKFITKRAKDRVEIKATLEWNFSEDEHRDLESWIKKQQFHLLVATPYFAAPKEIVMPAEMTLIRFSFRKGIRECRTWHLALGSEKLDEKWFEQAESRSSRSHHIPLNQTEDVVKWYKLDDRYYRIVNRIGVDCKKSKFIFVFSKDFNTMLGILKWLRAKYKEAKGKFPPFLDDNRIVCIEDLFMVLYELMGVSLNPDSIDDDLEPDDLYQHLSTDSSTACGLHAVLQAGTCSEAKGKKILYFLFERWESRFGLNLKESHIPTMIGALSYVLQNHPFRELAEAVGMEVRDRDEDEDVEVWKEDTAVEARLLGRSVVD